ncbi:hypothetical protein H4582DRAFT_116337 [Lactarius indigo]|nr:hypothetical protein H4582DRAFT_116337 [Lactarius indigo]
MKSAKETDNESSSNILDRLKQRFKDKPEPVKAPTKVVQFLLSGFLPDKDPEVVKQVLCEKTNVEEVLWNFRRLKDKQRITLKQNPHFYRGLPSFGSAYTDCFTTDPIEHFWDANDGIWVLTDERSRVFLETDKGKRAFGNFWLPDAAIIFKEIGGRLEGEGIVAKDIQGTPNLWHREESTPAMRSTVSPANPSNLPPLVTDNVRGRTFEDWRQLVRNALNSPNISIRISTKPTPPGSQDDWVLSSPTTPTPGLQAQSFSMTQAGSTGALSGATTLPQLTALQIPEPFPGPLSVASFETARSTYSPVLQTPQTVVLPPFAPPVPWKPSVEVPLFPEEPIPISRGPPLPEPSRSPDVVLQKPENPSQRTTSTTATLIFSSMSTTGSVFSPPPSIALIPTTKDPAPSLRFHDGGSQVENRTSILASVTVTTKVPASNPLAGPRQAESEDVPVKDSAPTQGKKKNWFQKYVWDYGKGK